MFDWDTVLATNVLILDQQLCRADNGIEPATPIPAPPRKRSRWPACALTLPYGRRSLRSRSAAGYCRGVNRRNLLLLRGGMAAALAVALLSEGRGRAQTLYDGSLGALPEAQGWSFGSVGLFSIGATNGVAVLNTSLEASTQAGWSRVMAPGLDRAQGFTLVFTAELPAETHNSTHRAGFSVILLAGDRQGIELGFWTDGIFAQSDAPLFTHGEDASFPANEGLTAYALTVLGTNYVLRANGMPLLSGPVRDYTEFGGLISPYRIPNFVFLGDNTRSAGAAVRIGRIALIRPVSLTCRRPGVISWIGVPKESYTVQASSNLAAWTNLATVTSVSDMFSFTNSLFPPAEFFRVVYP